MISVRHEPFKKNLNKTCEIPNEMPPRNPNNASNKMYKITSTLKQINISK